MFNKSIIAIAIIMCVSQVKAEECKITTVTSTKINQMIGGGLKIKNYDKICLKMKAANASFFIDGSAFVLSNKSIGAATIMLRDNKLQIIAADESRSQMKVYPDASQNVADQAMFESIIEAINNIDIDKALQDLDAARKMVKAAYNK